MPQGALACKRQDVTRTKEAPRKTRGLNEGKTTLSIPVKGTVKS